MRTCSRPWLVVLLALLGCEPPLGISDAELPMIRMHQAEVLVTPGEPFTVRYSFTNGGERTYYARTQTCSVGLDRREGSTWVRAWDQTECLAAQKRPVAVQPGETVHDSLIVNHPQYHLDGNHRLRVDEMSVVADGFDLGQNLPVRYRASDSFFITRAAAQR